VRWKWSAANKLAPIAISLLVVDALARKGRVLGGARSLNYVHTDCVGVDVESTGYVGSEGNKSSPLNFLFL
jgi:hypothetical protein